MPAFADHTPASPLTPENFNDWDLQVAAYLTGAEDYVRVITPTYDRIARTTPPNLTLQEIGAELILFNLLNGLPEDDRLRQGLITQKDLTFGDASMLRVDRSPLWPNRRICPGPLSGLGS